MPSGTQQLLYDGYASGTAISWQTGEVRACAGRSTGVPVQRVRHSISYMMLCGALDRAASIPNGPKFEIEGGVALKLRLSDHARASNDLDIAAMCADHDLVAALDDALRTPLRQIPFQVFRLHHSD